MGRNPARNLPRAHLAHLAARLMAEEGIDDYAQAKRKAARQAGRADCRWLPDNEEIEAALKTYRELYKKQHPAELRYLRERAIEFMSEFAQFAPHLTGSVLTGTAGKFADIQLQLFAESAKAVELYLLNKGISYATDSVRLYIGDMPFEAAVISYEKDAVTIRLTLLSPRELRSRIKTSTGGRPLERANKEAVELLLAQE
jgi:hypothetical protein